MGDLGSILGLGRSPGEGNLPWNFSRTEEPDRLQSMGSQRVGHNGATFTFFHANTQWFGPYDYVTDRSKFPELFSGVRSRSALLAWTRILGFRSSMRAENIYRACWKEEPKTAFLKKVSRTKAQCQMRNWRIKLGQK